MEQKECRTCWVCKKRINLGFLCRKHRKRYIYYKKYNFVALKPRRRKISRGQRRLFLTVRDVFKEPTFMEVIFSFLMCKRFDIVVPGKMKIFEADGRQHDVYVKHFHKSKKNFEEAKKIDEMKNEVTKANNYSMNRFNYKQLEDDDYVRRRVSQIAGRS